MLLKMYKICNKSKIFRIFRQRKKQKIAESLFSVCIINIKCLKYLGVSVMSRLFSAVSSTTSVGMIPSVSPIFPLQEWGWDPSDSPLIHSAADIGSVGSESLLLNKIDSASFSLAFPSMLSADRGLVPSALFTLENKGSAPLVSASTRSSR